MSEFEQFLNSLKRSGIEHEIHWGPTKKEFQSHILRAGYWVTALACTVVRVGTIKFLFSNGQAFWTYNYADPDDSTSHKGYGESGLFLLSLDNLGNASPRKDLKAIKQQLELPTDLPYKEYALGWFVGSIAEDEGNEGNFGKVGKVMEYQSAMGNTLYWVKFPGDEEEYAMRHEDMVPLDGSEAKYGAFLPKQSQ